MNEKYLQDLYGWIKSKDASYEDRYSYDQFKQKMQDEEYATKMHGWISSKDATFSKRRPLDTFIKEVGGSAPIENKVTNQQEIVEEQPVKKKFALESSSEDGSLEQPKSTKKFAAPVEMAEFNPQDLSQQLKKSPKTDAERYFKQKEKEFKETLNVMKETKARQIEEKKQELEEQKQLEKENLGLRKRKDFTSTLNSVVNSNLTSKTEEIAINDLRKNFERYGILFEETGFGTDKIIARTADGKKSIEIDFDNWTQGGNVEAANKLKDFISKNALEVKRAESGDMLSNSLKAQKLRDVGRLNPDGSVSTVKFMSFEEDGKFKVIPSLFPKDPNNYSSNPNTWTELPFKEALKLARQRGEIFEFKTADEANRFAKGSWKDVSPVDLEADKFYKERGLDYMANKKTYEEYVKVRDMVDFIEDEKNSKFIRKDDERAKKFPQLIINGKFRSDVDQLLEKYKKQEEELRGQVFDAGFISQGKIQKTREEFDEYLDKRQNKVAQEAAQLNSKAKIQSQEAEVKSLDLFGMSVKDLMKYNPKNEEESAQKDSIIRLYEDSKLTQSFAAKKYENAKTYFDAKVNKQIKGEYEDNWSAFVSSWLDAWDNGQAAEQILAFTLGIKDINSKTDKEKAAQIIVENLTNQSPNSSRAMARWQQATGFSESLDAFLDNPFELVTTLAATSLSQILPYGSKIVPSTIVAGAGAGAAAGLAGGPFAEITVPGGAVTGAVQGFRGGMAATTLALEYTNSILDVMREKGYDITDPQQVEAALSQKEIWDEGGERGLKRGIPIGVIDYLSAGLAGKVFKPTSALASTGKRVALQTAERAVFDPAAEATGELAAQITAGQKIDWKEISAEAMGGLGNNSSNMAINTYRNIKNNNNVNIANNLTDISFLGTESASDERISTWANNMHQLGKIDADVNQRIQENVGLRRDAREALSVGVDKNTIKPTVLARTMELMSAKEELSSSTNRKELYSEKIKAINEELGIIANTKELAPEDKSVDLSLTLGTTKKGVSQYMIDGVRYTKEQFLEKTKNMSARRILRSALSVKNDDEIGNELKDIIDEKIKSELSTEELANLVNIEEDAIQEQSTAAIPVQSETGISETVEGRTPETKPEVVTEQVTQEEVNPLIDVESTATALGNAYYEERKYNEYKNIKKIAGLEDAFSFTQISEAYHKAKQDNSNPELVEAVESLLAPKVAEQVTQEEVIEKPLTLLEKEFLNNAAENPSTVPWSMSGSRGNYSGAALFFNGSDKDFKFNSEEISELNDAYNKFPEKIEGDTDVNFVERRNLQNKVKEKVIKRYLSDGVKQITTQEQAAEPQTIIEEEVSSKTQPIETVNIEAPKTAEEFITAIDEKAIADVNGIATPIQISDRTYLSKVGDTYSVSFPDKRAKNGITKKTNLTKEQAIKLINRRIPKVSSKTQPTTQIEAQNETRTTEQPTTGPVAGNRLFNKPLAAVKTIADRYYKRVFGTERPKYSGTRKIDEAKLKRLSDAFIAMENNPNDPTVKAAYAAMAKETIDQYQELINEGYTFEFKDTEPYANSQEMIDDLRNNKHLSILSTEAEFGNEPITDQQRQENPLLQDSGFKDVNGKPLLINDVFRATHDFYGHAELGNSFGPKGEENAWQVHARMYSPLARRAMTMETRAQNAFVNFSGINEKIEGLRNEARKLREAGDEEGAKRIVEQIYKEGMFGPQKVGLVPEEFSNFDEEDTGDLGLPNEEINVREEGQSEAETQEFGEQGLNEQDLPGYNRMMGEVEGIIKKSKSRGVSKEKIADNVMSYVMGSKVYEDATDVQREALVRDIRKRFGLKEKSAPSVARLFGKIKDVKKITMNEKTALKKQIRDLARGARDAVRAFRLASQQLSKDIKELKKQGKITSDQAANVIRAFSKVNVFSQKSIDRFTTYMSKVFENADYAAKIKEARTLRGNIKKLSRNKDKNANLRVVAFEFSKIDPALIEDLEAYNEMAKKIKEAITGSSIRGQKVKFAETVNIQEATDYTIKTLKEQEQKISEERIAELQDLMGVDASEFTAEEMLALLEPEATTNKYNEGIVRATIKKAFDVYSSVIKESIRTGKDIFTDEDVEYTKVQKELIKNFMNMDTDKMSVKDSLAAVDSLMNFLTNQSTAKMQAVLAKYTGQQNANKIARQNIFAVPLKKLGFEGFGRFLGEQTTNLNILFEKMFVGFNRSAKVMDAMGLTDLVNGKSKAQRETNTIVANYVADFYNKKANNQKFNTLFNNVERGMTAFVSRNIVGTEAEMKAEFDRRKKLIEESIDVLSIGNEQERKKALVYQEVYDKILNDSKNIDEVKSKVDPTNLDAVDFWIREWDSKFEELSDTALNVYNKVLDKDLNYTPDRFTRMSYDSKGFDLANTDSAFITNTNGNLYKKETGVLMEASRPEQLPRNAESSEAESYIDLSFDKNNSNSMYDALVDINTAAPIRQIDAFMKTSDFRKIFGVDADIIKGSKNSKGRIQQYIDNIRGKNPYSNDEFAKAMRALNKIATLGVGQALAGPTQPLKQIVPVTLNTLVNTKGNIDFSAMSNKDFMNWLNESGYAIANRGVESQADIDSINKLIEEAAESKGAKAVKLLEDANKKWLKLFLVKPDVWVAVSSWKSYYEQALREQGVDTKGIDYSTHELNKDAANYAQRMVDRQQNISDTDMSGTMFSNRNPYAQTMVKIFMPFASFRMNQASRLGSDLRVLSNRDVSTAEDRKIAARSLAGYAVEMAVFRTISAGIAIGIASMTASLMGKGDDEEEKEKRRESIAKGAATSLVTDVLSPIPVLDRLIQDNSALIIEGVQKALGVDDKEIKNIYNSRKINFVDALGTFGITKKRIDEIWDLISLSATGTYKDDYGKTKQISEENRDALSKLVPVVLLSNLSGLASPEVSGVSRNAMKIAKKKSPTPEEIKEMNEKVEFIQKMIDEATSPEKIESAEAMLDRLENPEKYEGEKEELKAMKKKLLIDEETGTVYENLTDLKRYNPDLYKKNFGEGSEYYELSKPKKELDKMFKDEERRIKDEEFGYVPKKKRRKNSDGTYKKYSSSSRSSSGSGSKSSSNSKYEYYDSRGIKTTVTRSSNRNSKYD